MFVLRISVPCLAVLSVFLAFHGPVPFQTATAPVATPTHGTGLSCRHVAYGGPDLGRLRPEEPTLGPLISIRIRWGTRN